VSRERQTEPQAVDAPSPAPKPHERVRELVAQARNDPDAAKALVDALIEMRAPGDEADEARVLLQHLDTKSLEGLFDERGRNVKREAVKTLLSLGFPHALNVTPEDLAEYRRLKPDELGTYVQLDRSRRTRVLAGALLGNAVMLGTSIASTTGGNIALAVFLAAAAVASAAWNRARPATDLSAWPVTCLALTTLASCALAFGSGLIGLLGPAIAAVALLSTLDDGGKK
jgi:hypothetical protein